MELVNYAGWANCIRLTNGRIELILTTEVGPRIIRCGFVGGQNLFKNFEADLGKVGGDQWRAYGGHRFWHAPEEIPRTYFPDNSPVRYTWDGSRLMLQQDVETTTGIEKQIEVRLDPERDQVEVTHRLVNRNFWAITAAPWCLSVMAPGGRAIFPQEPFVPWPTALLPARPLVLWPYTDMSDPRYRWGERYIQFIQDASRSNPQKIGIRSTPSWGAYVLNNEVFLKKTLLDPLATYPDFGCNWEAYTNPDMLELETLGPLTHIAASGGSAEHVERWTLARAKVGDTDESISQALLPLVEG